MPRYLTFRVPHENPVATIGPYHVAGLARIMRPGDRIVSIYPISYELPPSGAVMTRPNRIPVTLEALIELRHPSWEKEGVGWTTEDSASS